MKTRVQEVFRKKPDQKLNLRQIAHFLDLPSEDYKVLRQALKELVHEGKVILDRDQRYALRDVSRVLKGTIKIHSEGFAFFQPESRKKEDVFIPKKSVNFAMTGDLVLIESYRSGKGKKYEGRVLSILQRAVTQVVGTLEKQGHQYFVTLRNTKIGLSEIYVPKKNLKHAQIGDLVGVTIVQYPGPGIVAIGEIDHVIGVETDVESLIEGILFQYDIRGPFSEKIDQRMRALPKNPPEDLAGGRKDLRDIPLITIDGVTAKDFDDAVCVQRHANDWVLYVCIADVAEYVTQGSELDNEAFLRSTSTYLPGRCIPMLPHALSNGLCSLNPDVPRLTLTAEIHYNTNGDFLRARYYKSLMRSRKRATYEEVEAYFDKTSSGDFSHEVQASLGLMRQLSEKLIQKSRARGTLGFDLPEAEVVYDAHGDIQEIRKRPRLYAHKLIEEFMIAANVCVAQLFSARALPLLYRVHDKPDPAKIQDFLTLVHNLGLGQHLDGFDPARFFNATADHPLASYLQFSFLRSLKQAQYSPDNIGHFGLNLVDYAHFTSPIRRYPDLTVHRQLRSLLEQTSNGILEFHTSDFERDFTAQQTAYDFEELRTIGRQASDRERRAMEAERDVLELTKVRFAMAHINAEFTGQITRIGRYGVFVRLDPHFVEGALPFAEMRDDYYDFEDAKMRLVGRRTRRVWKVGDKIRVQIVKASLETVQILLTSLEKPQTSSSKGGGKSKKNGKKKRKRD